MDASMRACVHARMVQPLRGLGSRIRGGVNVDGRTDCRTDGGQDDEGARSRPPSLSPQVAEVDVLLVPALALRGACATTASAELESRMLVRI